MFPEKIELSYSKELNKLVKDIEKKSKEIILSKKNEQLELDFSKQKEEIEDYFKEILTTDYCFNICADYVLQTVEFSITEVNESVRAVLGISYVEQSFYDSKKIEKLIEDNVKLIKAEPSKYLRTFDDQVAKLVKKKIEKGETLKDLSEAIIETTNIEKNRADLIAANEVGNVYASSTQTQFEGLGLKKFIWITSKDKRVRPSHAERDGKTYKWKSPPDGETPGSAIRCRCVADVLEKEVLNLKI